MISVTGLPRTGTSMMCHCLSLAGVPLAFTDNRRDKEQYRNPYGCYEGMRNGEDGLIKVFSEKELEDIPDIRIVCMYRDPEKVSKSWNETMKRINPTNKHIDTSENVKLRLAHLDKWVKKYPHIKVDYDTFVTNPEEYREVFITLFPELDYDIIIKGIDKNLYINR